MSINSLLEKEETTDILDDDYSEDDDLDLDEIQLVSFNIDEDIFGVNILDVQEIIKMGKITRIPNASNYIEGVLDLRGSILPVIDLRKKLGLNGNNITTNTRILVLNISNTIVGLIVDSVSEVLRVEKSIIKPPPALLVNNLNSNIISGVIKLNNELLIILDIKNVLGSDEITELSQIREIKNNFANDAIEDNVTLENKKTDKIEEEITTTDEENEIKEIENIIEETDEPEEKPELETQCKWEYSDGRRCERKALKGSEYCAVHQPEAKSFI